MFGTWVAVCARAPLSTSAADTPHPYACRPLDLVEQMVRVARGEELAFSQDDVKIRGHSLESRVYAEDPLRGFLPSTGRLTRYREPVAKDVLSSVGKVNLAAAEEGTVRVDSGVTEWSEISMHYDPMIAKLITHGPDRQAAIDLMKGSLDRYVIEGLSHNVNFLRELMDMPRYIAGDTQTSFIPDEFPDGYHGYQLSTEQQQDLLAITSSVYWKTAAAAYGPKMPVQIPLVLKLMDAAHSVTLSQDESGHVHVESGSAWRRLVAPRTWGLGASPVFEGVISADGAERDIAVQILHRGLLGYTVQHCGSKFDVTILTPEQVRAGGQVPAHRLGGDRRAMMLTRAAVPSGVPRPTRPCACLPPPRRAGETQRAHARVQCERHRSELPGEPHARGAHQRERRQGRHCRRGPGARRRRGHEDAERASRPLRRDGVRAREGGGRHRQRGRCAPGVCSALSTRSRASARSRRTWKQCCVRRARVCVQEGRSADHWPATSTPHIISHVASWPSTYPHRGFGSRANLVLPMYVCTGIPIAVLPGRL